MRGRISSLLAALALVATACAGTADDTTTTTSEVETSTAEAEVSVQTDVVIGLQLEPPTLDLTSSPAAAIPQVLLYNVYETLVKLEADNSITGLLAESWEISEDEMTYTFVLRDGLTFHNGNPLTAEDVVYSITNVLTKDPAHSFASTFEPIDEVTALDERTVQLSLSRPSANLIFFLTQGQGVILDASEADAMANEPVGSGPFRFRSWAVGDSIVFERNEGYWGDAPALDTVTFRYIPDPNALSNAMLSGDLDILAGLSAPELLEAFESDDRFTVLEGLTHGEIVLSLNGRNAPLDDVRVRRAISHAIDNQAVIDLAYAGYGTVIGTFSNPLEPWFRDLTDMYPYDPDRARELLDEANVEELDLRLVLPPPSYASRSGEVIASQLAEVGIDVEIVNVEWGVWLEDVFNSHDFDMSIVAHVEPRDLFQYGNTEYYWGDETPEVAALVEAADAEIDEAARNDTYASVLQLITERAADKWLFVLPAISIIEKGVTGFEADLPGLALDVTKLAINP